MKTNGERIASAIGLVASAVSAEVLKRAFFQLNDDLAHADAVGLSKIRPADFPSDRSRAALVAAALAYRFDELGVEGPAWLASPELISATPVFLTSGLDDLIRAQTPEPVSAHNVFVDHGSFRSV